MKRAIGALIAAAALMFGACDPHNWNDPNRGKTPTETVATDPATATPVKPERAETEAACQAQKGDWRRVCMRGNYMCVTTFADAGKTCSSSSECGGRCLAEGSPDFGAKVTGKCSVNNDPCGCFQTVEDGEAQPGLCVD